jgi:hypothetical protein
MSLLAPLRAGSSQHLLQRPIGARAFHAAATQLAAGAQKPKDAKSPGWTVQDVDEQLGKMQKQQEQMKRSGQHFDFYNINVPVLGELQCP